MNIETIEAKHAALEAALFHIDGEMEYGEITQALTDLGNAVAESDSENDELWAIGEHGNASLDALIVGAYWHFTEWHGGQDSPGYAAQCALGKVFSPGCTSGPELESSEEEVFNALNDLAKKTFNAATVATIKQCAKINEAIAGHGGSDWGVIDITDTVAAYTELVLDTDDTELFGELLPFFNASQGVKT